MSISLVDRKCRREVRPSGFSIPAPTTLESRRRKLVSEVANSSQRMNRRSSPNRCLMRPSWRTVRAMEVLPIPPAPMRAMEVRHSAKPMISSINPSRPKKTPRWWCRGFARHAKWKYQILDPLVVEVADLIRVWATVSVRSVINREQVMPANRFSQPLPSQILTPAPPVLETMSRIFVTL
jgi:hypothetical protein